MCLMQTNGKDQHFERQKYFFVIMTDAISITYSLFFCQNNPDTDSLDYVLSLFSEYIRHSLSLTREVITVLKMECQEARYILQPWRVESVITREADENTCICEKAMNPDSHVAEIAADISKMLLQAQQLREKLSLNVLKEKKRLRQPDVRTIYAPAMAPKQAGRFAPNSSKSGTILKTAKSEKHGGNATRKTPVHTVSEASAVKVSKNTKALSSGTSEPDSKNSKNIEPVLRGSNVHIKTHTVGTSEKTLKTKTSNESKKGKNFIAANKLRVKSLSQERRQKAISEQRHVSPAASGTVKACAASTTELNKLIEKISLSSTKSTSMPYLGTIKDDCPFHGIDAPRLIEERKIETLDTVEALDRFGILEEVHKVLKVYHAYMQTQALNEPVAGTSSQKLANVFLTEFEKMNDITEDSCTSNAHLRFMATEYMSALKVISRDNVNSRDIFYAHNKCEELDSLYEINHIKEFDIEPLINRKADELCKPLIARSWMSNGIWDSTCVRDIERIFRSNCIRYSNSNQLLSLFTIMQQLQQGEYFRILIDYILRYLIPKLKQYPDTTSVDYVRMYKMIFIISQGLNPQTPVLVRTDM